MIFLVAARRSMLLSLSILALVLGPLPADAQVTEVIVGVTPTCPYGISACWGGAYEALGRLPGVDSVAMTPDAYNCTAHIQLKQQRLPDFEKWPREFELAVGKAYVFRGVEVTVKGSVKEQDGQLALQAPGLQQPVILKPLQHKLQWNSKKRSARQPEPDERNAYQQLAARTRQANLDVFRIEATGPLRMKGKELVMEVREFFLLPAAADLR